MELEEDTDYLFPQSTPSNSNLSAFQDKWRSKRWQSGSLEVIQIVNTCIPNAVDYHTYYLENRSKEYEHTVLKNMGKNLKRLTDKMKSKIFQTFNSILIIGIHSNFNFVCRTNGIDEDLANWLFNVNMNKRTSTIHNKRVGLQAQGANNNSVLCKDNCVVYIGPNRHLLTGHLYH